MFPLLSRIATVIRTRHCRLQRSCIEDIEGSSGSVGFKAAIVFPSCSVSCGTGGYAKCETKVFGTHVVLRMTLWCPCWRPFILLLYGASHCWASQVWMNVMLPSCNAWGTWHTKPWVGRISTVSSGWCGPRCWSWMSCRCRSGTRVSWRWLERYTYPAAVMKYPLAFRVDDR